MMFHNDQVIYDLKMIEDSILSFYTNLYVALTNHVVSIATM